MLKAVIDSGNEGQMVTLAGHLRDAAEGAGNGTGLGDAPSSARLHPLPRSCLLAYGGHMAEESLMREYFAAWMTVGEVTRERAEAIVRDLIEAGDLQREQFEAWVERLLEWGRAATEALVEMVRSEVSGQLTSMGVVSREDMSRFDARLDDLAGQLRAAAVAPARRAKKTAETVRKRAPAKRGLAKKTPSRKSTTKKAAAKKAAAKKATAKRAATKRSASSAKKSRASVKRR